MLRLPVLMLTTLAGLFAVMMVWGQGDLRSQRRPAAEPAPTVIAADPAPATAAGAQPAASAAPPDTASPDPAPLSAAAEEAATGIERFAGPTLQISPEFADRAEGPAAGEPADGLAGEPGLWVTASRLNMRVGPSSGAAVVTGLDGGTGLVPLGPTDGPWVEVRAPGGQTGFVSSQFVTTTPPQ